MANIYLCIFLIQNGPLFIRIWVAIAFGETETGTHRIVYGSVALLSHFHKVLALSKFSLYKYEIEVNPVA